MTIQIIGKTPSGILCTRPYLQKEQVQRRFTRMIPVLAHLTPHTQIRTL